MGQTSGELTVVTSANLQASTTPSYALRVEVEDNFGTNTGTATINISVKGSNATESPPGDDEKRTTLIVVTVLGGVLLVAVVVFIVYKNKPANVSFIGKYRRGSTVFPKREKTLSSITLRMNGKVDTSVNTDTQFNKQSYVEGTRTNEVSNNHLTRQSST
ncbi:hypothetical protein MAR_031324 [Mya arenaria]|uniref:Cadherin domain-containing protein n=1 Tax=Mya arenaria TaxID=6604 RepID=A0ABY7F3K0_MYAAR|nr:hypothetical protein MAR_031324 [Mya arenaria]